MFSSDDDDCRGDHERDVEQEREDARTAALAKLGETLWEATLLARRSGADHYDIHGALLQHAEEWDK